MLNQVTTPLPSPSEPKQSWWSVPRSISAKPTLQGLHLDSKSRGRYPDAPEFIPWRRLSPSFECYPVRWFLRNDRYEPISHDRGWLGISVRGWRANRIALRAWQHGMRRHITEPDFHVVRQFRIQHIPVVAGLVMTAICLGIVWFNISGGITLTWRGDDWIGLEHASSYLILGRAFVLLFLFMSALPLLGSIASAVRRRLRPPLRFLSLDVEGLVAVLANGEQLRASYRDLEGLCGLELHIHGRRPLVIPCGHRDLRVIIRELIHRHADKTRPPRRWPKIRPWIIAGVMSLVLGGICFAVRPLCGERWPWYVLALSVLTLQIPIMSNMSARTLTGPVHFRPQGLDHLLSRRWRNSRRRRNP